MANVRGFSRRLTVVVIPLALALTAGTAQTSADRAFAEAAAEQVRDGIGSDLVATSPGGGLDRAAVDTVAGLPGVEATSTMNSAAAQVLTDADLDGVIDSLAWETTTVRSYSAGGSSPLLDLDTRAGSLDDLAGADTIAISSEALFGERIGVGDAVTMRWTDGTTTKPTVVAVYERGLGFGDFTVGRGVLEEHAPGGAADALLVAVTPGAGADVVRAAGAQGIEVASAAAYADTATASGAAEQRLSTVLLLALMAFIFLGAANTLVMVTARRGPELRLYDRTGATRSQLITMAIVEAGLTAGLAWVIGTLAVAPAVLGVGFGMLGLTIPPVDLTAYLVLSAAVLVLPLLTVVPTVLVKTGARATSTP